MESKKAINLPWLKETELLNCKACDRQKCCTIKELAECAQDYEDWLEDYAI